jgi:uncharacterized RmlC-like cupin family protein
MPIVDLSLNAGDDLIGERVVAIPTYGQGEHADFPARRIGPVDRPVQSRRLTAKLSIAVMESVLHYAGRVKCRDQEQTVDHAATQSEPERIQMKKYALIVALAVLAATPSLAGDMPVNADGLTWGPAPPVLPKGAQIAVLSGDPSKDGLYVLRLKMPAYYKIPAHNHPTSEYVTIISGKFHIGMGDKLDEKKGVELRTGGFGEAPAHMNHYAWASEETVVQVHGQGPFEITYVDPADDPSN